MSKASEPKGKGVKRRDFLKILGVSGAAVGAAGCSPENAGKLIPYLVSPDQTVPGVSTYYATTCRECAAACGIIAETRDGRTIKLEGNPDHPLNRGAICARGQSALQALYNPDRVRTPLVKKNGAWAPISWDDALTLVSQKLGEARSRNTAANAVFLNQHESGSFPEFVDQWLAAFGMKPHLSVDFEADQAAMEANRRAYGVSWPRLDFSAARLVISFGADFLDGWGASVPQQLDYADARSTNFETAPRAIYIGPRRTLTGLNSDQWIACKPGTELAIAQALQGKLSLAQAAQASGVSADVLGALAKEFASAKPSLLIAGVRTDNALDVAMAVADLNKSAGNVGKTVRPDEPITAFEGVARYSDLADAVERMRGGNVPVAMVRGTNPGYFLPASTKFAEAFAKVPFKVAFATQPDETVELCDLVLPDLHALENWGDAQPVKGTLSLQQPAMDPVFSGTRAAGDVMLALAQKDPAVASRFPQKDYRSWVMGHFAGGPTGFAAGLAKGVLAGTMAVRSAPAAAGAAHAPALDAGAGDFYLITYPHPVLGDGRGANKPWLQELPDPVAKILWSSWVEIHPETATRLGIARGDIVEVKTANGAVKAPAYLYLGVRPDTIAIPLGQGHRAATPIPAWDPLKTDATRDIQWGYGRYARNVGVNPFDVLPGASDAAGGFVWTSTKASITRTGDSEIIPSTEGSARQHGRGIAQAMTIADLLSGKPEPKEEQIPGDASHEYLPGLRAPVAADAQGALGAPTAADSGTHLGMYDPKNPLGMAKRRWAMTIDLSRCTGCSACVTACYAENNIPTVGAAWQNATVYAVEKSGYNMVRGREMNWIRIERYFEGAEDAKFGEEFEGRVVPMMCQQCGNAPCEPVCPVFATYHSPDGLNVQVYNRCVGTRYCSNNCPYKVRYFNWFGYGEKDRRQYAFPEPLNWQLNPDVTVRGKGVMEKCTFCVQRIREAESRAALEHRELIPDEFTTACAASCPSRAITFGDAADERWSVNKLIEDKRAYTVFKELNTYPAVVYLKKVNHPSPATAGNAS